MGTAPCPWGCITINKVWTVSDCDIQNISLGRRRKGTFTRRWEALSHYDGASDVRGAHIITGIRKSDWPMKRFCALRIRIQAARQQGPVKKQYGGSGIKLVMKIDSAKSEVPLPAETSSRT
jgi:hypothetical protein